MINYGDPKCGIVKKQMKISSKTPEDFEEYKKNLTNWTYYKEHVIKQIHNPNAEE